jgi:hypothetical protein
MTKVRGIIIASISALALMVALPILASQPSYYDFSQSVLVTNNTGADLSNSAARVPMNVSNLIAGGFVGTAGADLYMLNTSGGTQSSITAVDFATPVNDASLWVPITSLTNGATQSLTLYMGGNTSAADVSQSFFVTNASESVDVLNDSSLDITDELTISISGFKIGSLADGTIFKKGGAISSTVNASGDVTVTVGSTPVTSAADATGNNADAIFGGDAAYTSISGGKFYYGVGSFDGTGDYVSFGSAAALDNIFDGGGTFELWANISATGNNVRVISKQANSGSFSGGWMLVEYAVGCPANTAYIWFYQAFSSANGTWRSDTCVLDTTAGYQHVAVTYDNGSTANNPIFYLDGASIALTEFSTPSGTRVDDSSNTAALNSLFTGAGYGAPGDFDDVRFWDDVRTAGEISANYNTELTGSETGLNGYYRFNTGAASAVTVLGQVAANTASDISFTFKAGYATLTVDATSTSDATWPATLSTSTSDVSVLSSFSTIAWADRVQIGGTSIASPTYVLDLSFEPDEVDQTQEGTSGNGWIWLGNIYDQSGQGNDATYTLKRDTTGISVTAGHVSTTAAVAGSAAETNPTIVSGDASLIGDPYVEGTTVADFGFPLSLLATSAQAGSIPLMWFAGTITIALAALIGFIVFRSTKTPAWTILSVMMALGLLIYMTPIANGVIYLVVPLCLALVMLIPRSFEAVE